MTWYAIYRLSDGELVSVGTSVADPLPAGLGVTNLGANPPTGVWNKLTHVFDAAAPVRPIISKRDFWKRFTDVERESLYDMSLNGTAAQKRKLGAFRSFITDCEGVDLNDAYVQASVSAMETAGVIGVGRAAQIIG